MPERRHGLALLLGLGLPMLSPSADGGITVTRHLPDCAMVAGSTFHAELQVAVTGDVPNALVIEEELPAGWRITSSVWTGTQGTLTPATINGKHKWLLDPLEVPVDNGRIALTIQMSGTVPDCAYAFCGVAKWVENGVESTADVVGSSGVMLLTFSPGWNLLSLPSGAQDLDQLVRLFATSNGSGISPSDVFTWDSANGQYVYFDKGLRADQGFWAYSPTTEKSVFAVGTVSRVHLELHQGWNLIGVGKEIGLADMVRIAPIGGYPWWWDAGRQFYRTLGSNEKLVAGRGYWVLVTQNTVIDWDRP